MSKNLTALKVTQFDTMVKAEYQNIGFLLKNTTQTRTGVRGDKTTFNLMGQGMAHQKIPQDDVTPMNIAYSKTTAILENWEASDYTDIFDQQEVLFDEKQALAKSIGMAIGRRNDQIVINALDEATTHVIPDGAANMTYLKFITAVEDLNKSGVSRRAGRRFCAITAEAETKLLNDDKFINSDYVKNSVLNGVGLDGQTFLGINFIVIPDMNEGGLPLTGDIRSLFMWHEYAAGFALGLDFVTNVDWIAQKMSWLVAGRFKAAAKKVDEKGIVKINIDQTK